MAMAAVAGVLAFGLSEVPEDVLDPLAALLHGQHLAWRYRDRDFLTGLFLTCSVNGVVRGLGGMSSVTSCTGSAKARCL